jgi:hypothetical protein
MREHGLQAQYAAVCQFAVHFVGVGQVLDHVGQVIRILTVFDKVLS